MPFTPRTDSEKAYAYNLYMLAEGTPEQVARFKSIVNERDSTGQLTEHAQMARDSIRWIGQGNNFGEARLANARIEEENARRGLRDSWDRLQRESQSFRSGASYSPDGPTHKWLTEDRDRSLGRISTTLASFEQPQPPVKTLADAGVVQAAAYLTNQLPKLAGVSLVLA